MSWNYFHFSADYMGTVIDQMAAAFNLQPEEAVSSKVAMSNQANGNALGVIFLNPVAILPQESPVGDFEVKSWESENNFEGLLHDATTFLNSLHPDQAFYAKASMSNLENGNAWLSIWYPKF